MLFKKLILFSVILGVIAYAYLNFSTYSISKIKGPSTKEQINQSFLNSKKLGYTTLVLGSSKVYRGINPELLDSAYNFAHDNDIFNQIYYKIKYVLNDKKHISTIIIGYDYFSFSYISDTRNYVYQKYFPKEYLDDYNNDWYSLGIKGVNKKFNDFITLNFTGTFKPFIQGLYSTNPKRPKLSTKGQLKRFESAGDFSNTVLHDQATVLPIQVDYFNKIMSLCEKNKIAVFLVMMPTTEFELAKYSQVEKASIDSIAQGAVKKYQNVSYLKYETNTIVDKADFEDAIHLNTWGADKFTNLLRKDIYSTYHK